MNDIIHKVSQDANAKWNFTGYYEEYICKASSELAGIGTSAYPQLAIVVGDGSGSELYCRLPGEQSFTKM